MDVSEDYLSKNLNVIGQIQLHAKVFIRNGNIYIDDSYAMITSLKRFFMGDNRYNTLDFIRTLIHNTFVLCDRIMLDNIDEQYLSILSRLQNDLVNSKSGLGNIRDTYSNDARITSSVHVLIDNINVQDKKISDFFINKGVKKI